MAPMGWDDRDTQQAEDRAALEQVALPISTLGAFLAGFVLGCICASIAFSFMLYTR